MKTKREMQFLTYLDALERGDAEGISAFLVLAEADAELEKMLMDYHTESSPEEEKPKVITPFKRKREDANRWMQRFGSGLIAALMMILVGGAGVIIGLRAFAFGSTAADVADANDTNRPTPENIFCDVEILSEDNTITLRAEGDIDRVITVGVNNPFIVIPDSGVSGGGWSAIFEGLRVTVTNSSLSIPAGCERLSNLTVYPKDNPERNCDIEIERLRFPIERYLLSMESRGYVPYIDRLVVLNAPVDGAYPIEDNLFTGSIPAEFVSITGECSTYPLVYVQSAALAHGTADDFSFPTIELSGIRVNEQIFEGGAMFYLEEMNEIWVACETTIEPWSPWMAWPANMSIDISPSPRGNAPEGFFEPQGGFIAVWEALTSTEQGEPICDLGWAMGRMGTYHVLYDYEPNAQMHSITASTGDVYSFYKTEAGEHLWRINEE